MATIAENLSRIQSAKTDIKTAIEAKGVTVPSSATIDTYATYVSQISGGGSNALIKSIEIEDFTGTTFNRSTSYITGVTIPSGVTSIGDFAFYSCSSLTNIDIPNSVTSIGDRAFRGCTILTSVTIPSGVTSIGSEVFYSCSRLTSVDIPNSVTSIGINAFYSCTSLTNIDIPDSVTSIGINAFDSCTSLTSIDIPSGVTFIARNAFRNCSGLTSITVNATTPPSIGSSVFDNTNNCPIYVPCESVEAYKAATNWSTYADRITCVQSFSGKYKFTLTDDSVVSGECGSSTELERPETSAYTSTLKTVEIGDCVTSIGISAFQNCSGLTSVTIPSGVTSIGSSAFRNCSGLTSVTVNATTPPTLGSFAFDNTNDCPIYVPSASVDAYKSARNWSDYASRIYAIS